jgi:hypothetical protein
MNMGNRASRTRSSTYTNQSTNNNGNRRSSNGREERSHTVPSMSSTSSMATKDSESPHNSIVASEDAPKTPENPEEWLNERKKAKIEVYIAWTFVVVISLQFCHLLFKMWWHIQECIGILFHFCANFLHIANTLTFI